QGLLAVHVLLVVEGQNRDRDALVAARQEGDLVVDPAPAVAPASLEVQPPARWANPRDAPALNRRDRVEEPHSVRAVPRGYERVDVEEVAGLAAVLQGR